MRKTRLFLYLIVTSSLALGLALGGCGDDDSGGENENNTNNHHWYQDAGPEASTWPDAMVWEDAMVQVDAAPQVDAMVEIDGGGGTGDGLIGDPCTDGSDCDPPQGLTAECLTDLGGMGMATFPDGYCTATCTAGDPDPCGPDAVCASLMVASYCLKTCTDSIECRQPEYSCEDPMGMVGQKVCVPPIGPTP